MAGLRFDWFGFDQMSKAVANSKQLNPTKKPLVIVLFLRSCGLGKVTQDRGVVSLNSSEGIPGKRPS